MYHEEIKIYLAGPLFNEVERAENKKNAELLRKEEWEVYVPQEQMILDDKINEESKRKCFELDYNAIKTSTIMIANLNGVDCDSGTCSEIGIGFEMYHQGRMLCKPYGIRNDFRTYLNGSSINNFVLGCLYNQKLYKNIEEVIHEIKKMNF